MVAKLTSSRVAKCCYFCVEYLFVYNIFIWDFSNVIACLWFPLNTVHHLFLLIRTSEANVSRTAGYSCSYLKWSTSRTKSSNRLNFVYIRARSIWCTSFGTKVGARAAYRLFDTNMDNLNWIWFNESLFLYVCIIVLFDVDQLYWGVRSLKSNDANFCTCCTLFKQTTRARLAPSS